MTAVVRQALISAAVFALVYAPAASAQQAPPPKPDTAHGAHHGSQHGSQHGAHHGEGAKADAAKEAEHARSGWAELDAFHDVMSAAWHPARNDSLGVARASAGKLVVAARTWAASKAPKGCESPAVKSAIAKLVPETEAVAALVARKAKDAPIKAALKTVHDTYHAAETACKPASA